ncbi:MAG: tetratricopeptide repeat protein [Rhodocyclaceae bacterium]|nr:tetratricopeptide repeat protein [Rhodocyclaceae bacterium]
MSVINQMLRDLDARHASEKERTGLPPQLRILPPLPVTRSNQWRILAAGMAIGAVMTGLLAGLFMMTEPATPALPAAVPAAAVSIDTAPTSATPAAEEALRLPTDAGEIKLTTWPTPSEPAQVPAPAAAPPPIAKPKPEPVKPPPAPAPAPAPLDPKPATVTSAPPPAEAQIDKRSKDGRAHDQAENEYSKGVQAVRRGDNAAALPSLQRALELDPAHAKARQALLSVLVGSRQWDAARQVAQSGLAADPTQSGLATILARLQFEQGDTAAALDTLTRHAAHATGNADYQGLFAYLLQKQQRPAEAAQRFQAALALRPNEGRWWFGLGLTLESAGRGGEAKEAYAKAREVGNLPADMAAVVEQKLR